MARYIDAEVLKRKLIDEKNFFPSLVARAIDETPTADVVEVQTEPEPMKNILVVYCCTTKYGDNRVGRCDYETNAKLPLSIDSIKRIEEHLEKQLHYGNVVLLNYFLLGDE